MFTGRNYPLKDFLRWTRGEIIFPLFLAILPTIFYQVLHWKWLAIPWLPIAMIGTAVAFVVSFKNNASYDRMWEARRAWRVIINASRSWGITVKDYVTNHRAGSFNSCQRFDVIDLTTRETRSLLELM